MLQRHQRNNIDQLVAFARDQLEHNFLALKNTDQRLVPLAKTAEAVFNMYESLSYPFIGLQVIKQNMTNIKHPHAVQIQMILDKAQMFYLESFKHDINELINNQRITHIHFEDLPQFIHEINWKLSADNKESMILNESQQEIGENIDLMKFFEGVRNYQNWEENLEKRTIEKLKKFAIQAQKQLTLRKGFLISRVQSIFQTSQRNHNYQFITRLRKNSRAYTKLFVFFKIGKRNEKEAFDILKTVSKGKSSKQKLKESLLNIATKYNKSHILRAVRSLKHELRIMKNLRNIMQNLIQKKRLQHGSYFFKKISTSTFRKYEILGRALQKINKALKRYAVRGTMQNLGISIQPLIKALDSLYERKIYEHFSHLLQYVSNKNYRKQIVSDKIKAKILLSLNRSNPKQLNLRKIFLNWYLKGHEQKYAKMMYNIWMNGNISKFTFFMRLKNMLNEGKRPAVKQGMKIFLIIFMQKMNGYYNTCQKSFIAKWKDRLRYCKRLIAFSQKLQDWTTRIEGKQLKQAYENFVLFSKNKKYLLKYLNKRVELAQNKSKICFDKWKALPNVKKYKGQLRLLNFMREKLNKLEADQKAIFEIFRQNHIRGQSMKMKFVTKVFTKDLVYTANFFNVWRRNVQNNKLKTAQIVQKNEIIKTNALLNIADRLRRSEKLNKKEAIEKFYRRIDFLMKRKNYAKRVLSGLLERNQSMVLQFSYKQFKIENEIGKKKKLKLVTDFVSANKIKQIESIYIWKTLNYAFNHRQKNQRVTSIFQRITQMQRKRLDLILQNKFVFKFLRKIENNYKINIHSFIGKLHGLPPRIKWEKRESVIGLFSRLTDVVNRGKVDTYQKFKFAHNEGQFKKKKIMSFMYFQNIDFQKNYFKKFMNSINLLKMEEKNRAFVKFFLHLADANRKNLNYLFVGESLSKKKAEGIQKFNTIINRGLKQAFKLWYGSAKSLNYFNKLKDQKKKRVLGQLTDIFIKNQKVHAKDCLHTFEKNSKITQLQINFLKKLCDSQAGKAMKALMIWKNLPKPKNKELISKATKFEKNLYGFASKLLKSTLSRFKDEHYDGNESKKQVIRKIVAKTSSGINKYFDLWRKNNKLITIFTKCHRVERVYEMVFNIQSQWLRMLFEDDRTRKIELSFERIQRWWDKQKLNRFKTWKNKVKSLHIEDRLKEKSLIHIFHINKQVQTKAILQVITKIKKQSFLRNVLLKYFIQRQKLNIYQYFTYSRNLPNRLKIAKNNKKISSIIQLFSKLDGQVRKDKIKIFDVLRETNFKGKNKKLNASMRLLKDKITRVQKIIGIWQNLCKAEKYKARQIQIEKIFSSSFDICRANYSLVLQNMKESHLKKTSLEKMSQAIQIKKKGLFGIWRSRVKEMKMNEMMNNTSKIILLERINKIISGTQTETVKKTIKNFYLNSKITQIQVKFINKLLQTKSGKVMQAFNKWKKIPNQNLMQNYKKGQKFYFKLEGLLKNKLKQTHQCFEKNGEEGSTLKKQAVLQLLEITSSGRRKYYNRWMRITKRDHTLQQAYATMHSLDAMHDSVVNTFKILFEDQRSRRIKQWALEKMFYSASQSSGTYFKRWRQRARQIKMFEEMSNNDKKTALAIFQKVIGGNQTVQIKEIIAKFNKNVAITKISKNFLNKLLKTKSGKVFQLFALWKSIPDVKLAKKKKKAIKFESQLNKVAGKFLKATYQPFKSYSNQAQNKKRICIERMIRASMGEHKKKFIIWRQIVKQEKILHHTHLFDSMFERFGQNITNFLSIMFKNSAEEVEKKKNLCRKLINNSNFVQHHAYFIWKEALQTDNIKIQKQQSKVKANLLNLININEKVENKKLIQIISMFKKQMVVRNRVASDIIKEQKYKKAIEFYKKIEAFTNDKIGVLIKELAKNHESMAFIQKNNSLQTAFESMQTVYQQNLRIVIQSNRQTILVQKAFNRMVANMSLSTQRAFNLWREYKNVLIMQSRMSTEKKKNVLEILNRFLKNQEGTRIPLVIQKFEKNYKMTKTMKQILTKILRNKGGKVPLAFMIWKSLPNPGAKKMKQKAMKFQTGLLRLVNHKLRGTYDKFKDNTYQGNNKKRFACRKMILMTMSDSNRCFNKWRTINSEAKITEKINSLTQVFEGFSVVVRQNILLFDNFQEENQYREYAIRKLVENTNRNVELTLNYWRESIREEKYQHISNLIGKFTPQKVNARLLREAFLKIRLKGDAQILRTYINSLWKWKMSNVQANYYAKFIKIFKESEELLILSNLLNRKHNQSMHYAFRCIMNQGTSRHLRKFRITEKYLTRKLSNYFQRFKLGACIEEAKTWRNMYKDTVKGKKIICLIEQFSRKQLCDSWQTLMYCVNKQKLGEKFKLKLEKVDLIQIRRAFESIYEAGGRRFNDKLSNTWSRIAQKFKTQAFYLIKLTAQISKLEEKITKISQKLLKKHGYSRIHYKSILKARSKMSLQFIKYIFKQKLRGNTQTAINSFHKHTIKIHTFRNISNLVHNKKIENQKQLYTILRDALQKKNLLNRFKKGMIIKKILDKQDKKVLEKYFNLMKKKQNKWMIDSFRRFVIRSNVKASMAVSLWRLRIYENSIIEG